MEISAAIANKVVSHIFFLFLHFSCFISYHV